MNTSYSTYEIRCKALDSLNAGNSITQVSKIFGFDRTTIYRWKIKYQKTKSHISLQREVGSGRPRILSNKDIKIIEKIVKSAATEYGY